MATPTPTPKQRLLDALGGAPLDRVPVVCLGGPMSAAVSEVLAQAGLDFSSIHADGTAMGRAAVAVARASGFENVGLPLCATVEAEALGSEVAPADDRTEPRIARERYASIHEVGTLELEAALDRGRIPALLEAVAVASEEAPELPLIVNLLGPVTLAGSLVEPTALLTAMRTAPEQVHALLDQLDRFIATLAGRAAVLGADLVAIHEDVGDPKSIGPRQFAAFTGRHLKAVVSALRAPVSRVAAGHEPPCVCPGCRLPTALEELRRGVPVIVHCCELTENVWPLLPEIGATAWSVGAATSVSALRAALPSLVVLGNVSTFTLDRGSAEQVLQHARRAVDAGVQALCPACGLAMSTPLASIRVLWAQAPEQLVISVKTDSAQNMPVTNMSDGND
jgi:[methyl-Co(III) methanol-specific corrinoid protein]:coenzyme M methyltransferase